MSELSGSRPTFRATRLDVGSGGMLLVYRRPLDVGLEVGIWPARLIEVGGSVDRGLDLKGLAENSLDVSRCPRRHGSF
jgi:hypothetical protein